MARQLRIQYPGAFYHVMARGNRRQKIFLDDDDRRFFLKTLSEACERAGWRVHAWVLMSNHYHLFIETPEPNLVVGMGWLQNTLTRRFNVRHQQWGRVFGDRYKAILVEGNDDYHYRTLVDYIHLNPVRARLVAPHEGQSVLEYPWSSLFGGYAQSRRKRAPWLAVEEGFRRFGLADTTVGRRSMVEALDQRAVNEEVSSCGVPALADEMDARCSHLRRGWYWGGQAFADVLNQMTADLLKGGPKKSRRTTEAPQTKAHQLGEAEAWCRRWWSSLGLEPASFRTLKNSDMRKVALAQLLRRRTTVSLGWIAHELGMRSAGNVSQLLHRHPESLSRKYLGVAWPLIKSLLED